MFWTIAYKTDSFKVESQKIEVVQGAGLEDFLQILQGLRHGGKIVISAAYTTAEFKTK